MGELKKEVTFGESAREKMMNGVNLLANTVKATMGAGGRFVLLGKSGLAPVRVSKDGVSVATTIEVEDEVENSAIILTRQAALRANQLAGDGTTTATVITQALLQSAFDLIDEGKVKNVSVFKRDILEIGQEVLKRLNEQVIPVKIGDKLLWDIAKVSANNDEAVADLIIEAIEAVGEEGAVIYRPTSYAKSNIEVVKGMSFNVGLKHSTLLDENVRNIEVEDARVIATDVRILDISQIRRELIDNTYNKGTTLLIYCTDVVPEVIDYIAKLNSTSKGKIYFCGVPGSFEEQTFTLTDVAAYTGGKFISSKINKDLTKVGNDDIGKGYFKGGMSGAVLISDTEKNKSKVDAQLAIINKLKEEENDETMLKIYDTRISRLTSGIAVINVGGITTTDRDEVLDRVEDAVNATKGALEQGIVLGGGMALRNIAESLLPEDSSTATPALEVMYNGLISPMTTILENVYLTEDEVNTILFDTYSENEGYDALEMEKVDLLEKGIVDPVKVTISAFKAALSVATTILITEAVVTVDTNAKQWMD